MHPVERAQENAEADFIATLYGLLQEQARQVLALLRRQTDRPISDPRAQRLLAVIVAGYVQDAGHWQAEWVATLGALYLGIVATTRKLLAKELPQFTLGVGKALDVTHTIALDRAEVQAKIISQTIAADFAKVANTTAATIVAEGEAPIALGDVIVALQGAMLAPNALNGRAQRIAGTEAPSWLNQTRAVLIEADGFYSKRTWRTELDEKVRLTHAAQEGVSLPVGSGVYPNGCRFPGDPEADISEIANCRCYEEFS